MTLICFQEATRSFDERVKDQYKFVNEINRSFCDTHPYNFFAPSFVAEKMTADGSLSHDFGGQIEQGNYILSRYPIKKASSIFYYNHFGHWFDHSSFRCEDWARNALVSIVDIYGNLAKIINIHGMVNDNKTGNDKTMEQSYFILQEDLKENLPTIIVGDFNLVPECPSMQIFQQDFRNICVQNKIETTRPTNSGKEPVVIDHVLINEKVQLNGFSVDDNAISDHLPLILDFNL